MKVTQLCFAQHLQSKSVIKAAARLFYACTVTFICLLIPGTIRQNKKVNYSKYFKASFSKKSMLHSHKKSFPGGAENVQTEVQNTSSFTGPAGTIYLHANPLCQRGSRKIMLLCQQKARQIIMQFLLAHLTLEIQKAT